MLSFARKPHATEIHPRSSSLAAQFPLAGRVAGVWQDGGREGSQAHTHPIREAAGLTWGRGALRQWDWAGWGAGISSH